MKSENALAFLKPISIGLLKELEEDTSLSKFLSILWLLSEINASTILGTCFLKLWILVYQWVFYIEVFRFADELCALSVGVALI